jgi:antitoxin (DNA-binding transcriptional repressor) of toxin-antitoxin stability system
MQATLTEVHRGAKRVFRPVQAGRRVRITEHGKPIASIVPEYERVEITLAEFYRTELTDEAIREGLKESQV